jgi:hypothetical protein
VRDPWEDPWGTQRRTADVVVGRHRHGGHYLVADAATLTPMFASDPSVSEFGYIRIDGKIKPR